MHYAGLKQILDIFWPLNQHFKLENQRNWLKQDWTLKFWSVVNLFALNKETYFNIYFDICFNRQMEKKELVWTNRKVFFFFFNCSNWEKFVKTSGEFLLKPAIFKCLFCFDLVSVIAHENIPRFCCDFTNPIFIWV